MPWLESMHHGGPRMLCFVDFCLCLGWIKGKESRASFEQKYPDLDGTRRSLTLVQPRFQLPAAACLRPLAATVPTTSFSASSGRSTHRIGAHRRLLRWRQALTTREGRARTMRPTRSAPALLLLLSLYLTALQASGQASDVAVCTIRWVPGNMPQGAHATASARECYLLARPSRILLGRDGHFIGCMPLHA